MDITGIKYPALSISWHFYLTCCIELFQWENQKEAMASSRFVIILVVVLGIAYGAWGAAEETNRNVLGVNFPYGRGLNNELQLARLLLLPQWLCHPKRNSELINSLLGLPKNMNIAGK